MKVKYTLAVIATAFLILGGGLTALGMAQALSGSHLQLLRSDDRAVLLELTIDDFQIEMVEQGGQTYHRLLISDMAQTDTPGAPQVPTRGALLGLPAIKGVSVQVLKADYETLRGYRLYPAPELKWRGEDLNDPLAGGIEQTFALDQDLYASDAFYPGQPVELGHTGYMRDQAVAQVQFYPAQYNPVSGELRLYRRIVAQVTWEAPLSSAATKSTRGGASPAYENLLSKTILNYDALERPTSPQAGRTEGGLFATEGSTPSLKIGVTEDGLYQLNPDDLTGAGFDLSGVALNTIKISNQGAEIPIYVHDDDGNNAFNGDDYVLFYGSAITDVYTVENVYWLTAGAGDGQRMSPQDGTLSGSAPVPTYFPVTLHAEEDTYYWVTMPDGEGQDHWFWRENFNAPESRDYSLSLHNISTAASTATVRVRLKGRTDVGANPDHHTKIYLNSGAIDDQQWDGQIIYDHQVAVSHSLLNEGSNTVTVESASIPGVTPNQLFVNWIEVDYWDTYVAEDDALLFGAPEAGTFQFEVTNFSNNEVDVFDVTDPGDVAVITDTTVVAHGGGYKLQFEDAAQLETRYLALTAAARKAPVSIELDQPSSWKDTSNGADYILITHADFYTSSLRLASHRAISSGLRVATVKVEDVYDEFNYGVFNPGAIRDFLSYTYYNWVPPAPTYVLLLGGASYDYRDLLDLDRANYVPTQIIETDLLGQTPSDNWFVLVSGTDVLPDMFIGRLTPQTVSEAEDIVDKIIHYEQNPPDASWNKEVLLVADDDELSFETISEQLADRLPHYYTADKVYAGDYPPGDPTTDITNHINSGSLLVNYTGHGNVDMWGVWTGGHIFDRTPDATSLNNTHKLPVVTVANCLNGFFAGKQTSMAEEFLRLKDKGAVAVWAATSLGYPSGHRLLMREFYDAVFQDDLYALGDATTAAKIATYDQNSFWGELVETFVLLGDPATPLGLPANYPYVESTTPVNGASDVPLDQGIQVVFSKPMDPATVSLGGPGTAGLVLTPTWSVGNTVLDYAHTGFDYSQTLTFTISGQDKLGNPLGLGPAPSTWSFTTPMAPSDVSISGPTTGAIQTAYGFYATVSPSTATQPITYTWEATDRTPLTHTGRGLIDSAIFYWSTPGTKTITVTATNAGGTATQTHQLTVFESNVDIAGPTTGIVQADYTFSATLNPSTSAQPVTYTWEATGQTPVTHVDQGLNDSATFNWEAPGTKIITVSATNVKGTVTNTYQVTLHYAPPTDVNIAGPTTGTVNTGHTFSATVNPITVTLPITYVWEATAQTPVTHIDRGLNDSVTFTWDITGTKTVTVSATNAGGTVIKAQPVTINDISQDPADEKIYLPLVIKNGQSN